MQVRRSMHKQSEARVAYELDLVSLNLNARHCHEQQSTINRKARQGAHDGVSKYYNHTLHTKYVELNKYPNFLWQLLPNLLTQSQLM